MEENAAFIRQIRRQAISMAARKRQAGQRLNSSKILFKIAIGMVLLIALSSALAIYFKQEKQLARIRQRQYELTLQLSEAAADYAVLYELQQMAASDAYIERIARDQLGMVKPGEIIFQDD